MASGARVVVVGTGTDVGKTHVVAACLAYLTGRGVPTLGYKPVATGVGPGAPGDDAELHAQASGAPVRFPTFVYEPPLSPHRAARLAGRPVDLEAMVREARGLEASRPGSVLFVETAGGLFTPLADGGTSNVDLVARFRPAKILLVAPDRLGVLHDVGACLHGAQARGLTFDAVTLSAPVAPDASTGTNAEELTKAWGLRTVATFPRAPWGDERSTAVAAGVLEQLGLAPAP